MPLIESSFVLKLMRYTFALGLVVAGLIALLWSPHIGLSVLAGVLMLCANLKFLAWAIRHLLGVAAEMAGESSSAGWGALFLLKLLVLFGLTYYLIAVLGLSAIGFLIGYSLFVVVMVVLALLEVPEDDEDGAGTDEPDRTDGDDG